MTKSLRFWLVATVLTACGRHSDSNLKNVFGTDSRVVVTENAAPYNSLGRLDLGCTGTMVGKKLMLTAAHCVVTEGKAEVRSEFHNFVAHMVNGTGVATVTPVRAWIGGISPEADRTTDWAIVELSSAIGETQGHLTVSADKIGDKLPMQVSLVGYNSDMADGKSPSIDKNCNIRSMVENKIHHDCDAAPGISGAPILVQKDGAWQIVGISVSEFRNNLTPPVHRDDWSEQYSNVGTPSYLFASTVNALLTSVDVGQTNPVLIGTKVVELKFPTTTQPGNPNQPTTPPQVQPFGNIPYSIGQINTTMSLYSKIYAIQNLHTALVEDSKGLWYFSRQANNAYYMYAADRLKNGLTESINAYNALASNGPIPNGVSREMLYQCYVNLKSGSNQIQSVDLSPFPGAMSMQINQRRIALTQHMMNFERLLFYP